MLLSDEPPEHSLRRYQNRRTADFNLGFIPSRFNFPHKEEFDNEYMRKLYATGYDMALQGFPWLKIPPGFAPPGATATGKQ